MEQRSRGLLSPAMLVALIALVAALAGSAVALPGKSSVKSNDIAKHAVKGRNIASGAIKDRAIKPLAVRPPKIDLFQTDGLAGPVSTASATPAELGGPSVTVNVPRTGLVAVYARVTGQVNGGGDNAVGQVHLNAPNLLAGSPRIMEFTKGAPQIRYTVPGPGDVGGVANPTRGGFLVFSPINPGKYTFSLQYSQAGAGAATFHNAGIWAGVMQ